MVCFVLGYANVSLAEPTTLNLATSQREFSVIPFQSPGEKERPVVMVLGGAKGYTAKAYYSLANNLNALGIDVFLIRYIGDADTRFIRSASSAQKRINYYEKRMAEWTETIEATTKFIRQQAKYRSKIGVIGISLGAMPSLAYSANNSEIDAMVVIDGNFPANYKRRLRSLPPLFLIWGSNDTVFSLNSGIKLRDRALLLGGSAKLLSYQGEGHAFFLDSDRRHAQEARNAVTDFLSSKLLR